MKIQLTQFGVIGENGEDLQPEDNPHTVSAKFGAHLIASHRAEEYDAEKHAKKAPKKVTNGDPKTPTTGDPK